jgi:hypothetical protein
VTLAVQAFSEPRPLFVISGKRGLQIIHDTVIEQPLRFERFLGEKLHRGKTDRQQSTPRRVAHQLTPALRERRFSAMSSDLARIGFSVSHGWL